MTDLRDILQELKEGLDAQRLLILEVASVRSSQKMQKIITATVVVLMVVVAFSSVLARNAASNAQQTADLVERVLDIQEASAKVRAVEICQVRNVGSRDTRESFLLAYDLLTKLSPNNAEELQVLTDAVLPASETDRDCDNDGELTDDDYAP